MDNQALCSICHCNSVIELIRLLARGHPSLATSLRFEGALHVDVTLSRFHMLCSCTPLPSGEGLPRTAEPLSISQSLIAGISTLRWNAVRTCPSSSNELVVTHALTSCSAATRRHPSGEGLPGTVSVAMITTTVFLVSMMVRRASRHGKYMAFSVMLQRAVMPKCCSSLTRRNVATKHVAIQGEIA